MLNVFICEDNPAHHARIEKCVADYIMIEDLDMRIAVSTGDPDEIIARIEKSPATGLYFLDVDLNGELNGIQLAEKIRRLDPRGYIVFITVHADDMQLTFKYKVEALDYIVKGDFIEVDKRIRECIANVYEKYTSKADRNKFVIKIADNRIIALDADKILFFETVKTAPRKISVYSTDSRYEFYGRLDDVERSLGGGFVRCHRSYVVNVRNIGTLNLSANKIIMRDGSFCYMSVRHGKTLRKAMDDQSSITSSIV